MDLQEIKVRFAWFGAQADSWGEISGACEATVTDLKCIELVREDPSYQPIFETYGDLVLKLTAGTDGPTGRGYWVGGTVCEAMKQKLLETSYAYAKQEAESAADAAAITKMVEADVEARR
jgi:hypothetical protein